MSKRGKAESGVANFYLGGIPVHINPYIRKGEIWLVDPGVKTRVHCHEGPQAGETVEVWLRKAKIIRILNIGEADEN